MFYPTQELGELIISVQWTGNSIHRLQHPTVGKNTGEAIAYPGDSDFNIMIHFYYYQARDSKMNILLQRWST